MDTQKLKGQANKYVAEFKAFDRPKQLICVGALVTLIALFLPVVGGSVFGANFSVSFFEGYTLWSILVLLGAAVSVFFAVFKINAMYNLVAAAVSAIATIIIFISALGQLNELSGASSSLSLYSSLLKTSVGLGWGWFLLIPGVVLLFAPKLMPLLAKVMAKKPAAPVATPAAK
jgi:hypothetical protein